jgi:hypothetical protein
MVPALEPASKDLAQEVHIADLTTATAARKDAQYP